MTRLALALTLTPRFDTDNPEGVMTGLQVDYVLARPDLLPGDVVCRLPVRITSIPGLPLATADLAVVDDRGAVELAEEQEPPTPTWEFRRWTTTRPTLGDVHVSYLATPRAVDSSTSGGPLFDMRAEGGGLSGAGVTFLALPGTGLFGPGPQAQAEYDVTITWNLAGAPAGTTALTSYGEGDVRVTTTAEGLAICLFAVGRLSRYQAHPGDPFTMYWLSEPSFDPVSVAGRVSRIYALMCEFFAEPSPAYRVLIRRNPYHGTSGTAFRQSFMLGYSDLEEPTADSLTQVLAHETAHNWPRLDGEHAEIVWYTEGAAEYYSILLCHRAGLLSDTEFLQLINDRARAYYTNPQQTLSLAEVAGHYWSDALAQQVPYRRGLFYLIDVNAKIRRATGGRKSVDDLVLEEVRRHRAGEKVTVEDWVAMVSDILGDAGRADFQAMLAGRWLVPDSDALGPRFTARPVEDYQLELGFAATSWGNCTSVTGLVPGSAADRAGLRDGDLLIDSPKFAALALRPRSELTLRVGRGDEVREIRYAPRGAPVPSYEWAVSPGAPSAQARSQ